ncbi:MAG: hypothetical protein WKF37_17325 [Bryobacteraceae bacterium]
MIASMAGLGFRRFVLRPKWLGPVSKESALITLLILVLMTTYLAGVIGLGNEQVNWWLHTLALLVFLPLIPHTKHLHLLLSPITIFLGRGSFSRIPPLEGDEDFGIEIGKTSQPCRASGIFVCRMRPLHRALPR